MMYGRFFSGLRRVARRSQCGEGGKQLRGQSLTRAETTIRYPEHFHGYPYNGPQGVPYTPDNQYSFGYP